MRVGVTGHQRLEEPANWAWVKQELDRLLLTLSPPLIGITSLALGADQLFANAVLVHGGSLEIIIPFARYEFTFSEGHDREEYVGLLQRATIVDVLEKHDAHEQAYFAAGKMMVDRSELVIAVWDGKPAAGLGGTGDVVGYAMQQGKTAIHVNPSNHVVKELNV
jgi:hypothetical protein